MDDQLFDLHINFNDKRLSNGVRRARTTLYLIPYVILNMCYARTIPAAVEEKQTALREETTGGRSNGIALTALVITA